jgi:hypothetical protein
MSGLAEPGSVSRRCFLIKKLIKSKKHQKGRPSPERRLLPSESSYTFFLFFDALRGLPRSGSVFTDPFAS